MSVYNLLDQIKIFSICHVKLVEPAKYICEFGNKFIVYMSLNQSGDTASNTRSSTLLSFTSFMLNVFNLEIRVAEC